MNRIRGTKGNANGKSKSGFNAGPEGTRNPLQCVSGPSSQWMWSMVGSLRRWNRRSDSRLIKSLEMGNSDCRVVEYP